MFRTVFKYLVRSNQFARALIAAAVTGCCIQVGGNQLLVAERVMNGSEEERAQTPSSYLPSVALNTLPVCVLVIDYLIPLLPSLPPPFSVALRPLLS